MIPKIIHYCWLSGDEYPELIQKCIQSWKEILPDYEFMLWDTNRFDLESHSWSKQAFESRKYAFAADYIRLHAVYTHGGIYLDTDIEVLKSFNDLLHLPYFIGSEGDGIIEAGVFGAKKNNDWIAECLSFYENRDFLTPDRSFNITTLPRVMMAQIGEHRKIKEMNLGEVTQINELIKDADHLYLFPYDYFCAKNHGTGEIEKTPYTYCVHHFAMSWIPKKNKFLPNIKRKLMGIFGVGTINGFIHLLKLRQLKAYFKKK